MLYQATFAGSNISTALGALPRSGPRFGQDSVHTPERRTAGRSHAPGPKGMYHRQPASDGRPPRTPKPPMTPPSSAMFLLFLSTGAGNTFTRALGLAGGRHFPGARPGSSGPSHRDPQPDENLGHPRMNPVALKAKLTPQCSRTRCSRQGDLVWVRQAAGWTAGRAAARRIREVWSARPSSVPARLQQGRRLDPAVSAHQAVFDVSGLEQPHQERSTCGAMMLSDERLLTSSRPDQRHGH